MQDLEDRDAYHNATVRKIMNIGGIDGMVKFPYGLAISKDKHIAVLDRRFVRCVNKTAKGMQFVVYAAPLGDNPLGDKVAAPLGARVVRCGWLPSHCTTLARYGDVYVRSEWDVTTLNLISLILAEVAFDSTMTATAENASYRAVQDAVRVASGTLAGGGRQKGGGQKEDSVDNGSKTFRTREEAREYARMLPSVPTKITRMGEKSWRVSVKYPEAQTKPIRSARESARAMGLDPGTLASQERLDVETGKRTSNESEGYDLDPHDVDTDDYDDWYYGFFGD